ncbi:MAG: DUF1553 domain-containing protein [Prosthecobacter sp.]
MRPHFSFHLFVPTLAVALLLVAPLQAEGVQVSPAQAMGLLKTQCLGCHNAEKKKGGLSLETRELALAGGDNGPALKAGDASHSALIQSLTDNGDAHMPPKKQLPEKQINLLKAWVNAGAAWDDAALARFGELTPAEKLGALPATSATTAAALALNPTATRIAVGSGNVVHIRNTTKPELPIVKTLEGHKDIVQSLAWSPDGTLLAAGGYRSVIVWKVEDGSMAHTLTAPLEGRVTGLVFLKEGRLPSAQSGSPAATPAMAASEPHTLLLADGPSGGKATLHRWTLGESKPSQSIAEAHADNILSMTLSRDGTQLATGGADNLAKVWNVATLKETAKLEGHTGHVLALAFSPDGKLLLTTAADKESKTWDIATKELRMQFGDKSAVVTAVHWSADGKRISFWRDDGSAWTSTEFEDYSNLKKDTQRIGEKAGKETKLASVGAAVSAAVGLLDSKRLIAVRHDGDLAFYDAQQKLTAIPASESSSSSYSNSSSTPAPPSTPKTNPPPNAPANSTPNSGPPLTSNSLTSNSGSPAPLQPSITPPALSYTRDILPILTKAGCNLGSCHAKSSGQAGFRLSIFAFDPKGDHAEVVSDARGRRVFPALPEDSLILQKATVHIAHEGGQRFEPDSAWAKTIADWIRQGMPYEIEKQPALTSIAVTPAEKTYRKGEALALKVTAKYGDGSTRDVTALTDYISSEKAIASVDEEGHVQTNKESGETVIVARYMGMVGTSRVAVPAEKLLPAESYATLTVRNEIDKHLYARLAKLGHLPSGTASDSDFLRRSTLDAIGMLPTVEEARAFLADTSKDKHEKWIDALMQRPEWADHWAVKLADLIRPNPSRVGVKPVYLLDQWIRQSLRENKPWDVFARQLLTAQGSTHQDGRLAIWRDKRDPVDAATFVGQIFLGVRLECAKCHHHPTEKWDQVDYYQLAAYFTNMKRKGQGISAPISGEPEYMWAAPGKAGIEHPVTKAMLPPRPPADKEVVIPEATDPRAVLAAWMTDAKNPYFAHAIVNRVWSSFMGRGIVDPVDDFRASNPPTNAPLLDFLARDFVQHKYDLKHLMRTIQRSQAYRLSSTPNETNLTDLRNHSRSYRRRLPAETLLDAVCAVTEVSETFSGTPTGALPKQAWNQKLTSQFLDAFGRPNASADCPCERDAKPSIVQALHLMNSTKLQDMLVDKTGRAARLAKSDTQPPKIIEELYLASYSRLPEAEEMNIALKAFVAPGATRQTAIEDVMWSLLNSAEFVFNH